MNILKINIILKKTKSQNHNIKKQKITRQIRILQLDIYSFIFKNLKDFFFFNFYYIFSNKCYKVISLIKLYRVLLVKIMIASVQTASFNSVNQVFYKKPYSKYYNILKGNSQTFVNLLIKHGLKLRYIQLYSSLFFLFFKNFYKFDTSFYYIFPSYKTFFTLSRTNLIVFNIEYFYQILAEYYNVIFFVNISTVPGFLKKRRRSRKKYETSYFYLKAGNRFRWILKQLILSNIMFDNKFFLFRFFLSFSSCIFSRDTSFIHKQKLKIYKNILQTKRLES